MNLTGSISSYAKSHGVKPPEFWLQWNSNSPINHWLFDSNSNFKGSAKLAPLALVKKYELAEKYEDCTQQILKIWPNFQEYRGWLALQGTQCLVNQLKFFGTFKSVKLYPIWWRQLLHQSDNLLMGVWSSELIKSWSELSQLILKTTKLPISFRAEVAESWRKYVDSLNRSDRQELFKIITENLDSEGQGDWGRAIAIREGLIKNPEPLMSTPNPQPLEKKSVDLSTKITTEEEVLYGKFIEAIKQNQLTGATELAVLQLDKYPNGQKSLQIQDKLQQAYFSLWDSAQSPEQRLQIERCLDTAKLFHSSRLVDWARSAHRRADFTGAYLLAKQALLDLEKSPEGAPLLFIAGRSAYFMGKYREAVEFFDRLILRHTGYSEIWEVRFRKAFALIRLGEELKAEEALAELWQAPENKSYGLSSLYWLIRLKQKRKANVDEWLTQMQERFSMTYYGLKLSAESNNQKLTIPQETKPVSIRQSWVLTSGEMKQWERVQELSMAGWYTAAQSELNNLNLGGSAEQKFLWIQQLVQVFAYPQALRMMNDLMDSDPRWRKGNYLKTVFPKPLQNLVQVEAQKNEINPILIFSLIRQESAFHLGATSRSQAKGLMQLIPATANEVAQDLRIKNFDSDQMYSPITNLKFGIYYLAKVIRQFGGNVGIGLAAYNAGPQRLKRFFEARSVVENPALLSQEDPWSDLWLEELPWLETNLYVKSILRNRVLYQLLEQSSIDLPSPLWKDLFLGTKKVSQK